MKIDLGKSVGVEPCPLCASKSYLRTNDDNNGRITKRFWVKCDNPDCGCTTDSAEDQDVALNRWNDRLRAVGHIGRNTSVASHHDAVSQ